MKIHIRPNKGKDQPRWKHGTLPVYHNLMPTRKRLHLFWIGPIFIYTVPSD
jgi:hypothetical protein